MILLIGGASPAGKTVLAQKLLEKTGIPYLSIDQLKMGLIRSGLTKLTLQDDEELISFLWPVVREHACNIEHRSADDIDPEELERDNAGILAECRRRGLPCLLIQDVYPQDLADRVLEMIHKAAR